MTPEQKEEIRLLAKASECPSCAGTGLHPISRDRCFRCSGIGNNHAALLASAVSTIPKLLLEIEELERRLSKPAPEEFSAEFVRQLRKILGAEGDVDTLAVAELRMGDLEDARTELQRLNQDRRPLRHLTDDREIFLSDMQTALIKLWPRLRNDDGTVGARVDVGLPRDLVLRIFIALDQVDPNWSGSATDQAGSAATATPAFVATEKSDTSAFMTWAREKTDRLLVQSDVLEKENRTILQHLEKLEALFGKLVGDQAEVRRILNVAENESAADGAKRLISQLEEAAKDLKLIRVMTQAGEDESTRSAVFRIDQQRDSYEQQSIYLTRQLDDLHKVLGADSDETALEAARSLLSELGKLSRQARKRNNE